ncbi:hypothetical protein GCM10009609_56520 [Pseudonocardia aurantiaca]
MKGGSMGESASRPSGAGHGRLHGADAPEVALSSPEDAPAVPDPRAAIPAQRADSPPNSSLDSPPDSPQAPRTIVDPCVCGHAKEAHEHYRQGSDCGACGATACAAFRPARPCPPDAEPRPSVRLSGHSAT